MIRRNLPAKQKSEIKIITLDEIMEPMTEGEKCKILAIQTEITAELINVKKSVYNIGQLCSEAKSALPHGMFTPWIEQTFNNDLPYSTANFYMKIYNVFRDSSRTIQYIPTKYLLMIINKKFPEEILKTLKEHNEQINGESLQQVNESFDLFKQGKIGGSQFIRLAHEQIKLGREIWKGHGKHRLNTNMRQSLYFGTSDILKRINSIIDTAYGMAGVFPPDPENTQHKKVLKQIDDTIKALRHLKVELKGGGGMFRQISTENGDVYV